MFINDAIALSTREETIVRKYLVVGLVLMLSAVLAVPASANPPIVFPDSNTFPDVNPCSGANMMVTIDVIVSLHEHRNNFVVTIKASGTTDDGFVMVNGTETFVDNGNVLRDTFTDIWRNDAGDRFRASGTFVLNINTGTVQVDTFSLTCLGNT